MKTSTLLRLGIFCALFITLATAKAQYVAIPDSNFARALLNSTYQIPNSSYQVDLPQWDGTYDNGTKLSGGLYLLKLSLRSLLDGSKNEKITKVIISN